jgi:hypothetical protein
MTVEFEMLLLREVVSANAMRAGYSPKGTSRFARSAVHQSGRVMIRSSCTRCGASNIVSLADGSLQGWEGEHACKPEPAREEEFSN